LQIIGMDFAPGNDSGPTAQKVSKPLPRVNWPSALLKIASSDVVHAGIAQDELIRILPANAAGALADHNAQLAFEIDA